MINFTLADKQYTIPQELTIERWAKAIKFDLGQVELWPYVVNAVTDAPISLLKEVEYDSMELAIVLIASQMSKRQEVDMMNFDTMTFGQWVDLDVYSALGIDKHFTEILSILAPTAKTAPEALWALDKYSNFKKFILNQYKELFGLEDMSQEETEAVKTDPMDSARAWYKIIVGLANDDVLKLDEVTEQPLKKILNFMALQKQEALEEQERQAKQRRKYDLQRAGR
jgi:hypothetical protein